MYYSLFTAVAHCLFGLPRLKAPRLDLTNSGIARARAGLDRVGELYQTTTEELANLKASEQQFLQDTRRATTDEPVRERRTAYLIALMQ
jgi:hypothetical protein